MLRIAGLTAVLSVATVLAPAPKPDEKKPDEANKNTLITKHKNKLKVSASSAFAGWPAERLIDGNAETSWFSNSNDSVGKGAKPWAEIEFPEDVAVARVSVLGNREKGFPKGYAVLAGKLELFDKDGKQIHAEEGKGAGDLNDFDFRLKKPLPGVRKVRFTSTKDEGNVNGYGCIALAEIQIE
jgi:hypothetical protein